MRLLIFFLLLSKSYSQTLDNSKGLEEANFFNNDSINVFIELTNLASTDKYKYLFNDKIFFELNKYFEGVAIQDTNYFKSGSSALKGLLCVNIDVSESTNIWKIQFGFYKTGMFKGKKGENIMIGGYTYFDQSYGTYDEVASLYNVLYMHLLKFISKYKSVNKE